MIIFLISCIVCFLIGWFIANWHTKEKINFECIHDLAIKHMDKLRNDDTKNLIIEINASIYGSHGQWEYDSQFNNLFGYDKSYFIEVDEYGQGFSISITYIKEV